MEMNVQRVTTVMMMMRVELFIHSVIQLLIHASNV